MVFSTLVLKTSVAPLLLYKRYLHVNLPINSCGLLSCASVLLSCRAAPEPDVVFDSVLGSPVPRGFPGEMLPCKPFEEGRVCNVPLCKSPVIKMLLQPFGSSCINSHFCVFVALLFPGGLDKCAPCLTMLNPPTLWEFNFKAEAVLTLYLISI